MKHKNVITIALFLMIIVAFTSCKRIPKEPSKGAVEFLEKMNECSSLKEAEQLTGDYLNAYGESDRNAFVVNIINEIKCDNSGRKSNCLQLLSEANDSHNNPNVFEFMRRYLAAKMVIDHDNNKKDVNVLPAQEELDEINDRLPIEVADGTLFTKVTYNPKTMVQTFYYVFTQEVEKSLITQELLEQRKSLMVEKLKEDGNVVRLQAGVKYDYIYKSMEGKILYHIQIDSNDLQ